MFMLRFTKKINIKLSFNRCFHTKPFIVNILPWQWPEVRSAHTHARTHARTHAHTHTRTHAHTHTHTHTRVTRFHVQPVVRGSCWFSGCVLCGIVLESLCGWAFMFLAVSLTVWKHLHQPCTVTLWMWWCPWACAQMPIWSAVFYHARKPDAHNTAKIWLKCVFTDKTRRFIKNMHLIVSNTLLSYTIFWDTILSYIY